MHTALVSLVLAAHTLVELFPAVHTKPVPLFQAMHSPLVLLVQHDTSHWFHLFQLHSPLEPVPLAHTRKSPLNRGFSPSWISAPSRVVSIPFCVNWASNFESTFLIYSVCVVCAPTPRLTNTQESLESSLLDKENTLAKTSEKLELISSLGESLSQKELQLREVTEKLLQTELSVRDALPPRRRCS